MAMSLLNYNVIAVSAVYDNSNQKQNYYECSYAYFDPC